VHSSRALALPKISKNLVAYMKGLVAVSPYNHDPFDSRAKGPEHASAKALKWLKPLNKLKNEPNMAYFKHMLLVGPWYSEAPRPERKQSADDEEDLPAGGGACAGTIDEEHGNGGAYNGLPGLALY
jgi:hypothetical protein